MMNNQPGTVQVFTPPRSRCRICDGPIYRHCYPADQPCGPWLHAVDADWHDNPHNAEPLKCLDCDEPAVNTYPHCDRHAFPNQRPTP